MQRAIESSAFTAMLSEELHLMVVLLLGEVIHLK